MTTGKSTSQIRPLTPFADVGEPLLWNPLPLAAEWLTKRLGRAIDARALIDCIIKTRTNADDYPKPSIIKALLPRDLNYASIAMMGHPDVGVLALTPTHAIYRSGMARWRIRWPTYMKFFQRFPRYPQVS